jgi:hypothetical protein
MRWAARTSVCAASAVVMASIAVPRLTGMNVRVHWPPLHADLRDAVPPYLIPVALLGVLLALAAPTILDRLRWPVAVATTAALS